MQEFYYHLIYYLYFRSCCPIRIIMLGGRNYLDQKIYWGVDLGLLNAYLVLRPRTIWLKKIFGSRLILNRPTLLMKQQFLQY